MKLKKNTIAITLLISFLFFGTGCSSKPVIDIPQSKPYGAVTSPHPLATAIGEDILKNGGNAVDAAAAVGFALGVVDQFNSGIGGGGFIVIRMADGTVHTIDARETAPEMATRDMYLRDGEYIPELSRTGPLSVGVPGIVFGYIKMLELAGSQTLGELVAPSIQVAKDGFVLDEYYMSRYGGVIEGLALDSASAGIYLKSDGSRYSVGDVLVQKDLAKTYSQIAESGTDYFYKGEFAQQLADYMAQKGGLISFEDMAHYEPKLRDAVTGNYRGVKIIGMPPSSSGGVHVVQLLNMVESSGILEQKEKWTTESIFRMSQFMEKAFENRATYLGDSDFYPVPVERLTSKSYADSLVQEIMESSKTVETVNVLDSSANSPRINSRVNSALLSDGHTANYAVIDKWRNAVSVNQTVNLTFGAKITLPGTGVILNNQMDDFSSQPGVPNAFGLVGSEANSIAPGKRPLSSMSPTIVVKNDKPVLILGGAGGPRIITAVLHTIIGMTDFGMALDEALMQTRFHHQYNPALLYMESSASFWTKAGLRLKGIKPEMRDELGRVNAIAWDETAGGYIAIPEPRMGKRY